MSAQTALSCLLAVVAGIALWVTADSWARWAWRAARTMWAGVRYNRIGYAVTCVCTGFGFLILAWSTPGGVGPLLTFLLEALAFWLFIQLACDMIPKGGPPASR